MEICTELQHISEKNAEKLERAKNYLLENLRAGKKHLTARH